MGRRGPVAGLLAGWVLTGCGGSAGTQAALDVTPDGFHAVAARPTPSYLCDPEPTTPPVPAPVLPEELGTPESADFASAPTTLEAYAWTTADAEALVAEAGAAAAACTWTAQGDEQRADAWSSADWSGTRIVRTVPGTEQVDRRLVTRGEVVLLVVTRTDSDDPASLTVADTYLAAVADRLG